MTGMREYPSSEIVDEFHARVENPDPINLLSNRRSSPRRRPTVGERERVQDNKRETEEMTKRVELFHMIFATCLSDLSFVWEVNGMQRWPQRLPRVRLFFSSIS